MILRPNNLYRSRSGRNTLRRTKVSWRMKNRYEWKKLSLLNTMFVKFPKRLIGGTSDPYVQNAVL